MPILPYRQTSSGKCLKPYSERIFTSIVVGLIAEGRLFGPVLEAGGHIGHLTCLFASVLSTPIITVEPIIENVKAIRQLTHSFPHVQVHHGLLVGDSSHQPDETESFLRAKEYKKGTQVTKRNLHSAFADRAQKYTLDTFFSSQPLSFLCLDVEGFEVDVILGNKRILQRDLPVIVLEMFTQTRNESLIFHTLFQMNYTAFLVDEVCGYNADCRNVLFFPGRDLERFFESNVLDLAAASGRLRRLFTSSEYTTYGKTFTSFVTQRVHRMYGEGNPSFRDLQLKNYKPQTMISA